MFYVSHFKCIQNLLMLYPYSTSEFWQFDKHIIIYITLNYLILFIFSVSILLLFLITMAEKITKTQSSHDISGQHSEFLPFILPTNGDVCRKGTVYSDQRVCRILINSTQCRNLINVFFRCRILINAYLVRFHSVSQCRREFNQQIIICHQT